MILVYSFSCNVFVQISYQVHNGVIKWVESSSIFWKCCWYWYSFFFKYLVDLPVKLLETGVFFVRSFKWPIQFFKSRIILPLYWSSSLWVFYLMPHVLWGFSTLVFENTTYFQPYVISTNSYLCSLWEVLLWVSGYFIIQFICQYLDDEPRVPSTNLGDSLFV